MNDFTYYDDILEHPDMAPPLKRRKLSPITLEEIEKLHQDNKLPAPKCNFIYNKSFMKDLQAFLYEIERLGAIDHFKSQLFQNLIYLSPTYTQELFYQHMKPYIVFSDLTNKNKNKNKTNFDILYDLKDLEKFINIAINIEPLKPHMPALKEKLKKLILLCFFNNNIFDVTI